MQLPEDCLAQIKYYLMIDRTQKRVGYLQRDETGVWQRALLEPGENLLVQCGSYEVVLTLETIDEDVDL